MYMILPISLINSMTIWEDSMVLIDRRLGCIWPIYMVVLLLYFAMILLPPLVRRKLFVFFNYQFAIPFNHTALMQRVSFNLSLNYHLAEHSPTKLNFNAYHGHIYLLLQLLTRFLSLLINYLN